MKLAKRLSQGEKDWVDQMVARLRLFKEEELFQHHVYTGAEMAQLIMELARLAPVAGYDLKEIKILLLAQLLFAAACLETDPDPLLAWAATQLQCDQAMCDRAVSLFQPHLPRKVRIAQEASEGIKQSGHLMVEAWKEYKIPNIEFVNALHTGLRHYAFIFRKPVTVTFDKLESTLPDVLSHGGIDPESRYIFTRLKDGGFEIHIPKTRDVKSFSFLQYLAEAIGWQPPNQSDRALRDLVYRVVDHYHPRARIDRVPKIPMAIDLAGNPVFVHFATGGFAVGSPDSGKSTFMKLMWIMLMLMYPPEFVKLAVIDWKSVTFSRFTKNWNNPWALCPVLTEYDLDRLSIFFEKFEEMRQHRAQLMRSMDVENWLEYNQRNPNAPLSYSPLLIDEAAGLKAEWDKDATDFHTLRIASRYRYTGMPMFAGTQYPSVQLSFSPAVRDALGTKAAFYCGESCAKLAFSSASYVKATTNLLGKGDTIIEVPGNPGPIHAQALDAPGDLVDLVLEALMDRFPGQPYTLDLSLPQTASANPLEAPTSATAELDDLLSGDLWSVQCPKCRSRNVNRDGKKGDQQRYRCKECNHVFAT